MANDPNNPNLQDIINAAGALPAAQQMPPQLSAAMAPTPAFVPQGDTTVIPPPPTLLSAGLENRQTPTSGTSDLESRLPGGVGTTENLESRITSPTELALRANAARQAEAVQNPSMISKIGQAAAGLGGAPQLADPNASWAAKGQGIANILSRIGNAGASAFGSPTQKQQAIERVGQLNQLAQMQNEAAYRQGMLGNTAQANAIKAATEQGKFGTAAPGLIGTEQQKQQIAQQKANDAMRLKGYVPQEGAPGAFRAMTPDEILADPQLSSNMEMRNAAAAAKNASAALATARQQGLTNSDSLTQQNFVKSLEEKERVANAQLALAGRRLSLAQEGQNRQDYRDLLSLGQNMQGQQLGPQNAAPGMLTDATGQPVPYRAMSQYAATSQMKNVSAQAKLAAGQIPSIIKEVDDLKDQLGPVAGRWNEFMQGRVGTDNPAFAGLRADLMMQGTAVALAHARGRLPENLRQEFDNMINAPQQSPENIKAVLSHIQPWLEKAGSMSEQPMNPPNVKPRANAAVSQTSGHKIGDSIVQNGRTFKVVSVDKDGKVTGAE
jgi:hypothetical protein